MRQCRAAEIMVWLVKGAGHLLTDLAIRLLRSYSLIGCQSSLAQTVSKLPPSGPLAGSCSEISTDHHLINTVTTFGMRHVGLCRMSARFFLGQFSVSAFIDAVSDAVLIIIVNHAAIHCGASASRPLKHSKYTPTD